MDFDDRFYDRPRPRQDGSRLRDGYLMRLADGSLLAVRRDAKAGFRIERGFAAIKMRKLLRLSADDAATLIAALQAHLAFAGSDEKERAEAIVRKAGRNTLEPL